MADTGWIAIDTRTWRYEEEAVRFFLLAGAREALLIDSGMWTHNALELARNLTDLPISLLNTHADRDHVGSDAEFARILIHPAELVHPAMRGRTSDQVTPIWDGQVIDLGGRPLEVIALPGHTPGSVALLDTTTHMLFSGDPIQRGGRIFMFGPMRSLAAYVHSLERLSQRAHEISTIWPCHAECPVDTSCITQLIEGAKRIEQGLLGYTETEMHGTVVREYDAGPSTLLLNADGTL